MGHEFTGTVVETGSAVKTVQKGDLIVSPFTVSWYEEPYLSRSRLADDGSTILSVTDTDPQCTAANASTASEASPLVVKSVCCLVARC